MEIARRHRHKITHFSSYNIGFPYLEISNFMRPIITGPRQFGFVGKELCGTRLSWFHFVRVGKIYDRD
jgi:hypothetical protein